MYSDCISGVYCNVFIIADLTSVIAHNIIFNFSMCVCVFLLLCIVLVFHELYFLKNCLEKKKCVIVCKQILSLPILIKKYNFHKALR